jgi:hypothetical protein
VPYIAGTGRVTAVSPVQGSAEEQPYIFAQVEVRDQPVSILDDPPTTTYQLMVFGDEAIALEALVQKHHHLAVAFSGRFTSTRNRATPGAVPMLEIAAETLGVSLLDPALNFNSHDRESNA